MALVWTTTNAMENAAHPDAAYALEVASWILYKLTAEKYPGVQTTTEVYSSDDSICSVREWHRRFVVGGAADAADELHLHRTPVVEVLSVLDSGAPLASESYELIGGRVLRSSYGRPWNLRAGVEVTYRHGMYPPLAGRMAAARLADEFVLSFRGDESCRLPDRVTSVSRQGVSYTVLDPQEFMRDGRTGVYEVDLFVNAANPARAKLRPRVFSPDGPRRRRL